MVDGQYHAPAALPLGNRRLIGLGGPVWTSAKNLVPQQV